LFPNLLKRAEWYDLPLLSTTNNVKKQLSYMEQNRAMTTALQFAGVISTSITHINRKTGAQLAELGGASSSEIARAGGWAQGVMENVYLSNLPREAMRSVAGFRKDRGGFYLPRAVQVPSSLLVQVFPMVEKW
jgi:hypothetical protein